MEVWELSARESIRHTIAAYNAATDRFRLDDLAQCFTSAGTLEMPGADPLSGRRAIVDGLGSMLGARAPGQAPSYVRHFVASTHISELSPTQAMVSSYFAVVTDLGLDHWGRYRDVFSPVEDTWLISSRRIVTDGFASSSLMRPAAREADAQTRSSLP